MRFLQDFQGEWVRAEGLLYPPPASRFGARDSGPSRVACLSFGTRGVDCSLNGLHPKHDSPYFAHLDQEGNVSRRESRKPRRLILEGKYFCEDRAGPYRLDSKAGSLYMSAYDELTVADNGGVRIEDGALMDKAQDSCGYMEGGGWAAETPGARSETDYLLRPHRPPSLDPQHGPQLAHGRERGWLRCVPSVAQEICPGEELYQREPSVADGGSTPRLSNLFAYAFPDDERHQGWLSESTRESSRSGGGGGTKSTCSGVAGADRSSLLKTSSLPPLLPGDGADATTKENDALVVTVRRPPSPQFSFMTEDCSPDASTSPATPPKHRTPEDAQQRDAQGTSFVNGKSTDAWMSGANQQGDDSTQSRRPSGIPFDDNADIPTASTTIMNVAESLSADAGRMTGEEVRLPALSRKRRHPAAREAVAPRESHRSPSPGCYDARSPSEDGTWLGWRRRRGHRRNGWWGAKVGYHSPSVRDQEAVGAPRLLQVDDAPCRIRGHMMRKHVEASVAAETERYEPSTAGDGARCEAEASKRDAGGNETAAVARNDEIYHVEGDGRRSGGDRNAALAFDQDVLGGDGLAEAGVGDFEPETVAGVLGKLRCDGNRTMNRQGLSAVSRQETCVSPHGSGVSRLVQWWPCPFCR